MSTLTFSLFFLLFFTTTLAEVRLTTVRSDTRPTIPIDEFGFTHSGHLDLNISRFSLSITTQNPKPDLSRVGFLLSTRDSWLLVLEQFQEGEIKCSLDSQFVKPVFTFNQLESDPNDQFDTTFEVSDANQYTLVFANCAPNVNVSMNVLSSMYNLDVKSGDRVYLSVGRTLLPSVYFIFALVYIFLVGWWVYTLFSKKLSVFGIHFFMLAVVILKTLNLLCEAEDKLYIKKTGSAHGWDVLFYIFSFLKGITLFSLIVLIGTGWSFIKPYLQNKERNVLIIVIPLQVVANVAQIVIDETGPFGEEFDTWKQVFLLVDIVCCCAVLFPIVWSIKNLREAARTDGKAAVNLMKLTLFRHYYVVVICYMYFTRVGVYALETIVSYRYEWTTVLAAESATLAFYIFTGYKFRPKTQNLYFAIGDDEEEAAAAETLKLEDEFEL